MSYVAFTVGGEGRQTAYESAQLLNRYRSLLARAHGKNAVNRRVSRRRCTTSQGIAAGGGSTAIESLRTCLRAARPASLRVDPRKDVAVCA